MNKFRKNRKKGFTLVEMVLSLAIICLLGGVIAGVCAAISNSFKTTYNIDDSTDYAMLYAKGFENSFLSYTQGAGASGDKWSWYVDSSATVTTLKVKDPSGKISNVFEPKNIGNSTTDSKWSVYMFYKFDTATATVYYKVFIKDNYAKTSYVYVYENSFWVPQFEERAKFAGAGDSRSVTVSGSSMDAATFTSYGFDADGLNTVSKFYDPSFKSVIEYNWG